MSAQPWDTRATAGWEEFPAARARFAALLAAQSEIARLELAVLLEIGQDEHEDPPARGGDSSTTAP